MIGKRLIPSLFMALVMAVGASAVVLAPADVRAADKQKVSAEVGKPLQDAQKLIAESKFKEAMAKVQEADGQSKKSPYDQYVINDMKGFVAIKIGDYGTAARAYEALLNSGMVPGADVAKRQQALATLYMQVKNYDKALVYVNALMKSNGGDAKTQMLASQLYYKKGNYADAAKYGDQAIQAVERAGQTPGEDWLQTLWSSQYQLNDSAGQLKTLDKLVRVYPKPKYWDSMLGIVENKPGVTNETSMEYLRLRLAVGAMSNANFVEMAETALLLGFPGEAKAALQQGYAAGVLGKGTDAARHKRLLDTATQQAAADIATLPSIDAQAKAAATGEKDVILGEAYISHGKYQQAIQAIERGLAKGGVKDANTARLYLGRAYAASNQKAPAKQAFSAVTGTGAIKDVARLWLMHLG